MRLFAGDEARHEPASEWNANAPGQGKPPESDAVFRRRPPERGRRQTETREPQRHQAEQDDPELGRRLRATAPEIVCRERRPETEYHGQHDRYPAVGRHRRHRRIWRSVRNDQRDLRNGDDGREGGKEHQPVQNQVAEEHRAERPCVGGKKSEPRRQVVAVLAQMIERPWFWRERIEIRRGRGFRKRGGHVGDIAAVMEPRAQPAGDVAASGDARHVVEVAQQPELRQRLRDAEVECRAANAAAGETQRGQRALAFLSELAIDVLERRRRCAAVVTLQELELVPEHLIECDRSRVWRLRLVLQCAAYPTPRRARQRRVCTRNFVAPP